MTSYHYSAMTIVTLRGQPFRVPALAGAYPRASWAVTDREAGRVLVRVTDPPAALLTDPRFPRVCVEDEGDPLSVEAYRRALRVALDRFLADKAVPVTVGANTVQVPATLLYQAYLRDVRQDVADGAASVTVQFRGQQRTLTSVQFVAAYKAYRLGLRALAGADATAAAGALDAAQSAADLDAITLGG